MNHLKPLFIFMVIFNFIFLETGQVFAEGFSLREWSARGVGLAGGLVGRADDASAIAYNPAGITQLKGTHLQLGASAIQVGATFKTTTAGNAATNKAKPIAWVPPHIYATHQLNDDVWLGLGVYSRFGLGNDMGEHWAGRYNMTYMALTAVSAVPTIAYKVNDMLSLAASVEVLYAQVEMKQQIPTMQSLTSGLRDNEMKLDATGYGFGAHLAAHFRFNKEWSFGLVYNSAISLHAEGKAKFGNNWDNLLASAGQVPRAVNSNVHSTIMLPDSVSAALTWRPQPNLSVEVGTTWTRWSSYSDFNVYFNSGFDANNPKKWNDGWRFDASVEWSPLQWLALRAGVWYETPVVNSSHGDFMMPTNGRVGIALGAGFVFDKWTIDLAYSHIWINDMDISDSDASGIHSPYPMSRAKVQDISADMFSATIGYKF